MPAINDTTVESNFVKVFETHGISLEGTSSQMYGECPFCERDKIYVNPQDGRWDCKVCMKKGNIYGFIQELYDASMEAMKVTDPGLVALARDRGLRPATLVEWGVCKSITTDEWLVPSYNHEVSLNNLYRRVHVRSENRHALFSTPNMKHGLHGLNLFDSKKDMIYVCEGVWDGMALWEALRYVKREDDGSLSITGNPALSMLDDANVIAVPSAGVFNEWWTTLFKGKNVILLYDNDHPQEKDHGTVPPVGYEGMIRAASVLFKAKSIPYSVSYLHWGDDGYTKNFPHRYDVRDDLTKDVKTLTQKCQRLSNLLDMIRPAPDTWKYGVKGSSHVTAHTPDDVPRLNLLDCDSFQKVENAFKQAMEWNPGLRGALAFNLAIIMTTELQEDQVWGIVMSPGGSGKTTLAEAMTSAWEYVVAKDTITGFSSGYKTDAEGEENHSLLKHLRNKTLIIKEADTIMRATNRPQILSQLRSIYDKTFRPDYRNGMSFNWEGQNTTVILNGTSSLMELDAAEKGARFVQYSIMDDIDEAMECATGSRCARSAWAGLKALSNGKPDSQNSPEMTLAKQLTGGYINRLRTKTLEILSSVEEPDDELFDHCVKVGQFVAFMRSRPPKNQDEIVEREFSPRLVKQHTKLMGCFTAVLNKKSVDDEVMGLVTKIGMDTARGETLDIARLLRETNRRGMLSEGVARELRKPEKKIENILQFLARIKVVEESRQKGESRWRWRLTQRVSDLYDAVAGR